jgi:hypothetical protein
MPTARSPNTLHGHRPGKPDGSGSPGRYPHPPCSGPLSHHSSGPPKRASIPVLAVNAQPPSGLPSRPTCGGAGPLQVLKIRGFWGNSKQPRPVRPVYTADQPIAVLKGTGILSGPTTLARGFHFDTTPPRAMVHSVSALPFHFRACFVQWPTVIRIMLPAIR